MSEERACIEDIPLVLYFSIPFCSGVADPYAQRTSFVGGGDTKAAYMEALTREFNASIERGDVIGRRVEAVCFGGGGPSVMSPDHIGKLALGVRRSIELPPGCEFGIEVQPYTVGVPSLSGWGIAKFNRINLHVGSLVDAELQTIHANHSVEDVQNAVLFLDKFHANNLDVSIAFGLPSQTEMSLRRTLRSCMAFEPRHVTLQLWQSNESRFVASRRYVDEPDKRRLLEHYLCACDYLESQGFEQYAYNCFVRGSARSAYREARYRGVDVLGFGAGAKSCYDGYRFESTSDFSSYIAAPTEYENIISSVVEEDAPAFEARTVNGLLSLCEGFTEIGYERAFSNPLTHSAHSYLDRLISEGLLAEREYSYSLTPEGRLSWFFLQNDNFLE